ncbi:MAG: hypothetical protein QM656_08985 [Paracoccaceae bacterium]
MNRLFRSPAPGKSGYVALAIFVFGYLGMMTLVVAPQIALPSRAAIAAER